MRTIDGWQIIEEPLPGKALGECDRRRKVIRLDPEKNQSEDERLDTLCHEITHRAAPSVSERTVRRIARYLSTYLMQQGYRRDFKLSCR